MELNIGHFLIGEAIFRGLGPRSKRCAAGWTRRANAAPGADPVIRGRHDPRHRHRSVPTSSGSRRTLARFGDRFRNRVFTEREQRKAERRPTRRAPMPSAGPRKEACSKALGTGLRMGIAWKDMAVSNLRSGQPVMHLTGWAAERLAAMTPPGHEASIHVTLTDDHPWAQAFVVIEARPLAVGRPPSLDSRPCRAHVARKPAKGRAGQAWRPMAKERPTAASSRRSRPSSGRC
jgi:holo-[acyl-carrier protein] synthase